MFATFRLLFVYLVLGVPAGLIGIPWSVLRKDFRTMYGWGMKITALGPKAAGVRVRVEGLENVQPGVHYIFLSNHVSNLDAPLLLPSIPGMTSVFIKRELMKIPLLGTAMRMGKVRAGITRQLPRGGAAQRRCRGGRAPQWTAHHGLS